MALAVVKRKSGEEYRICNTSKKLSTVARMWDFWGLKDGSANLGFILRKQTMINNRELQLFIDMLHHLSRMTNHKKVLFYLLYRTKIIHRGRGKRKIEDRYIRNVQNSKGLQWPVSFIFPFWWKANTPIVRIVREI